jgi:hypothetical protein
MLLWLWQGFISCLPFLDPLPHGQPYCGRSMLHVYISIKIVLFGLSMSTVNFCHEVVCGRQILQLPIGDLVNP